jgi:hypothetical protein
MIPISHISSNRIEINNPLEAIETYYQKGWTDGLPVVPPTEEKVEAFLQTVNLESDFALGAIPERNRVFTVEKVAINAIMAGCLPEYFPVVIAAVQAITDPAFGLHGPTASTAGTAFFVVVNGPIANKIGMNSGQNLLGPGNRANATIGRALRLVMMNIGGSGEFDRSTLGNPGKYSFCIAEDETTEWMPLHVQRGFRQEDSVVTVFAAEAPNQVHNHSALDAERLLLTIADRMRALGSMNLGGHQEYGLIICKEHYNTLQQQGFDKARVQQFLFEQARRPVADLKRFGMIEGEITSKDEEKEALVVPSPEHILLVVGGGEAGRFSACIPGWYASHACQSVSKKIDVSPGGS